MYQPAMFENCELCRSAMFENREYVAATANQLILRILVQLNRLYGSPRPCDGISVPDYGFDRCAGHHEMVDLRLTKKARLGRGLEFRDSTYQLGPALLRRILDSVLRLLQAWHCHMPQASAGGLMS